MTRISYNRTDSDLSEAKGDVVHCTENFTTSGSKAVRRRFGSGRNGRQRIPRRIGSPCRTPPEESIFLPLVCLVVHGGSAIAVALGHNRRERRSQVATSANTAVFFAVLKALEQS